MLLFILVLNSNWVVIQIYLNIGFICMDLLLGLTYRVKALKAPLSHGLLLRNQSSFYNYLLGTHHWSDVVIRLLPDFLSYAFLLLFLSALVSVAYLLPLIGGFRLHYSSHWTWLPPDQFLRTSDDRH